jgi:multidrug efflux system membrane fusion protein
MLLIHDRAVLTDQDRRYVYVLGPNNTAVRKDVTLGVKVNGLRVVTAGLKEGDQVVVNGTRKIFAAGQPVAPVTVPMDQPDLQVAAKPDGGEAGKAGKDGKDGKG